MEFAQKLVTTKEEKQYREKLFDEDSNVCNLDIYCTICKSNINWMIWSKKQIIIHPVLEVLLCEGCSVGKKIGEWIEVCVWCGVNKNEYLGCTRCPLSFCKKCIFVNFGYSEYSLAKLDPEWKCYMCSPSKLWVLRAICASAKQFIDEQITVNKSQFDNEVEDCAICLEPLENLQHLPCNHTFHRGCLNEGIETNRLCRVCGSSYVAQ